VRIRTRLALFTVSLFLLVDVACNAAVAQERSLTKQEVAGIYEGKSWLWTAGVAYFGPKGRFKAATGSGKDRVSIDGNWSVSDGGQMCFYGTWRAKAGDRYDRSCLLHKTKDGHIYQRLLPNGAWYVFKHEPQQDGDQYKKLVPGNQLWKKKSK
jgi:hypothetical protein